MVKWVPLQHFSFRLVSTNRMYLSINFEATDKAISIVFCTRDRCMFNQTTLSFLTFIVFKSNRIFNVLSWRCSLRLSGSVGTSGLVMMIAFDSLLHWPKTVIFVHLWIPSSKTGHPLKAIGQGLLIFFLATVFRKIKQFQKGVEGYCLLFYSFQRCRRLIRWNKRAHRTPTLDR